MIRSRNEIAGMTLKAARGAGVPLGVAEELGEAAGIMEPQALHALAGLLNGDQGIAALVATASALDLGQMPDGDFLGGPLAEALNRSRSGNTAAPTEPLDIPVETWAILEKLAAQTFVPETEASRAAGAGAGEIDND